MSGWALFVDSDVVLLRDPRDMLGELGERPDKAIYVVKHPDYRSANKVKMDGQQQRTYRRKNWSSVMLFNCDHPAVQELSLKKFNNLTGLQLHQFSWLKDSDIGELRAGWNWLVGEQEKPEDVSLAHFTLGIPGMPDAVSTEYDDLWRVAAGVVA